MLGSLNRQYPQWGQGWNQNWGQNWNSGLLGQNGNGGLLGNWGQNWQQPAQQPVQQPVQQPQVGAPPPSPDVYGGSNASYQPPYQPPVRPPVQQTQNPWEQPGFSWYEGFGPRPGDPTANNRKYLQQQYDQQMQFMSGTFNRGNDVYRTRFYGGPAPAGAPTEWYDYEASQGRPAGYNAWEYAGRPDNFDWSLYQR